MVDAVQGRLQLANQEVEFLRGDEADTRAHRRASRPCTRRPKASRRGRSASWCTGRSSGSGRSPTRCRPSIVEAEGLSARTTGRSATSTSPADERQLDAARERLKFDELFTLELGVAFRKHRVEAESAGRARTTATVPLARAAARDLPFEPTGAQRRAMARGRRRRWRGRAR